MSSSLETRRPNTRTINHTKAACLIHRALRLIFLYPGQKNKPGLYFTARGTSQNERFHSSLRSSVLARQAGAQRVEALVGTFVFQWNIRRGIEKRGDPNYHTYHLGLILLINSLMATFVGDNIEKLPYPELAARLRQHTHPLGIECSSLGEIKNRDADAMEEDHSKQPAPQGHNGRVRIIKDGRSVTRAILCAKDAPSARRFSSGTDKKTIDFITSTRRAAVEEYYQKLSARDDDSEIAQALGDTQFSDLESWRAAHMTADDSQSRVVPDDLGVAKALGAYFDVNVMYSSIRPGQEGLALEEIGEPEVINSASSEILANLQLIIAACGAAAAGDDEEDKDDDGRASICLQIIMMMPNILTLFCPESMKSPSSPQSTSTPRPAGSRRVSPATVSCATRPRSTRSLYLSSNLMSETRRKDMMSELYLMS